MSYEDRAQSAERSERQWAERALVAERELDQAGRDLIQANEALAEYKAYYGTSVAQVKHLAACTQCCPLDCSGDWGSHDRCSDYPGDE